MIRDATGFEVLGLLGEGGFGRVYRARYHGEGGFQKLVALKMLLPEMGNIPQVQQRLRDEARLLGLVQHRGIVKVERLLELEGRWTIVMEFVEGVDLGTVTRLATFPLRAALEVLAEVAGAIDEAWNARAEDGRKLHLLHRDIKPSNIRLTRGGEVKVLDFGVARADFEGREALTVGASPGTLAYMSPERLANREYGVPADVYSLGAVLLELLTGRLFGQAQGSAEEHAARVADALELLEERCAGPAAGLAPLVAEMLAWEPSARPAPCGVEWTCRRLLEEVDGQGLLAWCRAEYPRLGVDPHGPSPDGLVGTFLVERREGHPRFGLGEDSPVAPAKDRPAQGVAVGGLPAQPGGASAAPRALQGAWPRSALARWWSAAAGVLRAMWRSLGRR